MATASKPTGIPCPCPLCGASEGLAVRVHNLTVECTGGESVGRDDLQRLLDAAARLLRWLDSAETV